MMNLFTVIIPTFNHVRTLEYSIQSVLNQTIRDFKLIVVGDGAPSETGTVVKKFIEKDSRVQYFPHEKGAGHGELYRHKAIVNSKSKYVCYLCDDDLWLPQHLEILEPYLEKYDFINSTFTSINPQGDIRFFQGRLQDHSTRIKMKNTKWNFFGPTSAAHRRSSYFSLPHGWRPRPDGMWSDLHMWRQWIDHNAMDFFTIPLATSLHFPSPQRIQISLDERLKELESYWRKKEDELSFLQLNQSFSDQMIRDATNKIKDEEDATIRSEIMEDLATFLKEHYKSLRLIDHRKIDSLENHLRSERFELAKLRNAKSTQLGFTLTYPLRKIYDHFNSKD